MRKEGEMQAHFNVIMALNVGVMGKKGGSRPEDVGRRTACGGSNRQLVLCRPAGEQQWSVERRRVESTMKGERDWCEAKADT